MITNLNSFKDLKKAKKIEKDLEKVKRSLQTCLDILKHDKQYITIMESMSTLSTAYKITEIQLVKCKQFIERQKND